VEQTDDRLAGRPLRYHLRFQIIPGVRVERDARTLAKFCRAHGIEEVVLFFAAEEWNNGLLSARQETEWFETVARAKPILDAAGIVCSLNPWMTVLHGARGRRFPKDRSFKPMVSPMGEVSKAVASFSDPAWQEYLFRLYGRFARLGFRVLWVEDDFRYHNHRPLTWGGGFEEGMIARFERRIGRRTTRAEVVEKILKPGRPHPWRAQWMETWRETQLEVAAGLARAVAANAPGASRLGLMTSYPATHSVEGRDWGRLFEAVSIGGRVAHRPGYAGYSEGIGRDHASAILLLDAQRSLRPPDCEVAPEVENYPFTNWTKSDSLTWAQMATALFFGSDALLLDLFPFCGNPADREPEVGALLDRSRRGLEWIAARFTKDLGTRGVGLPWRPDAAARVRTQAGKSLEELAIPPFAPGQLLLQHGVPVSAQPQKVNAIFGSVAWVFSDAEIREILSGGLLLDGLSAEILCRRGFGPQIGVRFRKLLQREESNYGLEAVAAKETGVPVGHYFNVNIVPRVAVLEPRNGAREWTTIITPERTRIGASGIAYANRLGGRVFTFAAPNPAAVPLSHHRQALVQNVIAFLARRRFASPIVTGGPYLMPIHFQGPRKEALVIFNGSPDPARPIVRIPGSRIGPVRATLLAPLTAPAAARASRVVSGGTTRLRFRTALPYLGFMALEWRRDE